MKKYYGAFLLSLAALPFVAQTYPPYQVNVCTPASHGYYFMDATVLSLTATGNPTQIIMDSTGQVIFYRPLPNGGGDFKIQPNGQMSYLFNNKFIIMDSTFTAVDTVRCLGYTNDGHDLQILPNGHFLLLGLEIIMTDLSGYYYFGPNHNAAGSSNAAVKWCVVQEQDQNHNVVFEWHAKDHLPFTDVDSLWLFTPNVVDVTHCNAVELDDDGNLLLSSRHYDAIFKINRSDSSLIWTMGGKGNQFTFVNDPAMYRGQHDIRRIANGNVTLWDNGMVSPFHYGSAKEYTLDEVNRTATLSWNYIQDPSSFSMAVGDVQRLSNGNTLIDFGVTDLHPEMFDVVDPSGNKVFELQFDDTLRTYRAFNYLSLPWRMPRTTINCVEINSQFYLDAGPGNASYKWSTGDTTQMILVTAADTFSVFVPIGDGGYMRSEDFIVTDVNNPCGTGIEDENSAQAFTVYPVPADRSINVDLNVETECTIEIIDVYGRSIFSSKTIDPIFQLDCSSLVEGVYFIRVNDHVQRILVIHSQD